MSRTSPPRGKRGRASNQRPSSVLVFGEDPNDTKALGELLEALRPALRRAVRPKGLPASKRSSFPKYEESDAPKIARRIKDAQVIDHPRATSASFAGFRQKVLAL